MADIFPNLLIFDKNYGTSATRCSMNPKHKKYI